MKDVIAIGDATEDVFLQLTDATVTKKKNRQELCMEFGTKLPVAKVDDLIGGNAMNAAVGVSRLGLRSALYVELGNDAQGDKIKNNCRKRKLIRVMCFNATKEQIILLC